MNPQTPHSAAARTTPRATPSLTTVCTAATLYLMSQYAQRPCPLIAYAITDQLRRLAAPSTAELSPVIRRLAASLLPLWHQVASCGTPRAMHH